MKNIHILPTDKPSRLYKTGNFLLLDSKAMPNNTLETMNQHIYITSDEEIKDGDWYLDTFNNQRIKANEFSDHKHYGNACKKIILTTDQDLIKDGVQAIDDEFLKWFVKNPSCEWVDVKRNYLGSKCLKCGFIENHDEVDTEDCPKCHNTTYEHLYNNKIIIPQEEPKQETLENERIFKNKKWYSENGTVYNEADDSVRIALVFDNGSYMNLPIEIANKISQLLNN
jgi:ssDNA-binding Zn-finger/Zn-ribbon topoisomerase 1